MNNLLLLIKPILNIRCWIYVFVFYYGSNGFKSFAQDSCHLRVSILTCGVGNDLYSCYGHSAIRIIDSCKQTDVVYNYGTFNFSDPDFYWKFTRGKLLYYLNDESFEGFMRTYIAEGRSVVEQELQLSALHKKKIDSFLQNNLQEEHKYYRYDFLFDNCSTRIRDLFPSLFGDRFELGNAMKDDSCSFRDLLDFYERERHWERFGINLLLSDIVDRKMTNKQSMFLPDYLMKGLSTATIDAKPIITFTNVLLPAKAGMEKQFNQPKLILWVLLLGVFFLSTSKTMSTYLIYLDVLLFLLLGLLGCFMLFMWFGTEHLVCAYNRHLFWAFPLHIAFAFLLTRVSDKKYAYAKYASWLIVLSFFYGFVAEQKYMSEITPLLFLLLFRLGSYSKQVTYFAWNRK
jgi:hypothetical protein